MSNTQYELFTGLEAKTIEIAKPIDSVSTPWPDDSIILYAIENNEIIGRTAIIQLPHIEGTWIREDKRNGTVGIRLISKIENVLEEANRTSVFSFIHNSQPELASYMERLGYELLPLKVYTKPLINKDQIES